MPCKVGRVVVTLKLQEQTWRASFLSVRSSGWQRTLKPAGVWTAALRKLCACQGAQPCPDVDRFMTPQKGPGLRGRVKQWGFQMDHFPIVLCPHHWQTCTQATMHTAGSILEAPLNPKKEGGVQMVSVERKPVSRIRGWLLSPALPLNSSAARNKTLCPSPPHDKGPPRVISKVFPVLHPMILLTPRVGFKC